MHEMISIVILTISLVYLGQCQENAGTNVAPALRICYNTTRYVTREYRLPATINILIELIRKIEDGNPNQDAREISYEILHRFRQDGIRKTSKEIDSSQGLPYSPKGWEAYKNRVQLTKITPGNAINFNNDSISTLQACSLHSMVSSTIEINSRGDESTVCSKTARYTSRIRKRYINEEFSEADGSEKSTCPIESGVIYTKWGAVKAGIVFAGIASGFQPMTIDSVLKSSYASTVAGELAETALNQISISKTVGNGGGWNNTIEPKYYFLKKNTKEDLYFTDAEIRGSLDGLYLSDNIPQWKSKSNNIKISQILDLYYSRGVFNDSSRACNRKQLIKDLISSDILIDQTVAFSKILDKESSLQYTPNEENLPIIAANAVNSFITYVGSSLNDVECSAENDYIEPVATDVLIFLDTAWSYSVIQPIISYVLENININKYESSFTIFDGANCDTIVNKSTSILDFYENYNLTQQQKYPTGFDYVKVVQTGERIFKAKLDNETDLTGQSTVILMLPHNSPTQSQSDYVQSKRNDFRSVLPDVKIIVVGSNSESSYNTLVSTPSNDIFSIDESITDEVQLKEKAKNIIDRFKKLPRSIVNHLCGSSFSTDTSTNFEITQYVEPSAINYHKISPNYFYNGHVLKIRGQGYGNIIVCTSRTDVNPKSNSTHGTTCNNLVSDELSLDISTYCTDDSITDCEPIYISVQGESSNIRCTDKSCRFPDNIKYTIYLENVECSSSGERIFISLLLIFSLFVLVIS